jgi:hypothetical protein
MTDKQRPTPDDRELVQYLQGDSKLSRQYREASGETAPPELDDAILAQARSELRRRPRGINRWLAPVALAASVMLGVNLGWNVYQAQPVPGEQWKSVESPPVPEQQASAPAAPPPALESASESKVSQAAPQFVPDAPATTDLAGAGAAKRGEARVAEADAQSAREAQEDAQRKAESRRQQAAMAEQERALQKQAAAPLRRDALAGAATESAAPAAAVTPSEPAAARSHGWVLIGAAPQDYRIGLNNQFQVSGNNSLTILSRDHPAVGGAASAPPRDFGTLASSVPAAQFRGRNVTFDAWVRPEDVKQWTGLWLRVDSAERKPLRFENMAQRPIRGTGDWRQASITLDVPVEAESIAFGLLLYGSGRAFIDAAHVGPADGGSPEYFYDFEERQLDSASAPKAAGPAAPAAARAVPVPAPKPWTEAEKIERLIMFVAGLHDVDFIRNGTEHSPEDAAKHMRMKREKAGDRVKTADDFIRLCASHSYITNEAYLIRFPDGRTRTAEDVLREQLATMR